MGCLSKKDIGRIFWRVQYRGILTQCLIEFVNSKGNIDIATIRIAYLTDFRNQEYKLIDINDIEYIGTSSYSIETMNSSEFYFSFDEAKKISLERYEKEVNPNGKYRVVRYFDNFFESYITNPLPKKEAQLKCNTMNKSHKAYVSYGLVIG